MFTLYFGGFELGNQGPLTFRGGKHYYPIQTHRKQRKHDNKCLLPLKTKKKSKK